jgi:serine/threonine protein kinase
MSLEPGARLGPYKVAGQIGAGGMGEVYRATDTSLGREVAIKVLPRSLDDAERLARFEREARLLASLNHGNIAVVYGLDAEDGTRFIAMELVEGETLADRIERGALPVEAVLRLAQQIAGALEAAHGKGVIHRDLKPANIMLAADEQVKVLDFGLAKAFTSRTDEVVPTDSPTLSLAMTQQGLVLGTAAYMSPEQASGQATDQRTDVWAFGVVLYEMLTGLPLFRGESVPHVLADVLKTEPDWSRLPPNLHPRIRLLLERCLTKNPRSRLHSIADARIEIEAVLTAPEGVEPETRPSPDMPVRANRRLLLAAVAALPAGVAAGWYLRKSLVGASRQVSRYRILLPPEQRLTASIGPMIGISPDGSRIAYAADKQIYLRYLDAHEIRPIPGTLMQGDYGAMAPVFAPDGQSLIFIDVPSVNGPYTIWKVRLDGRQPEPIFRDDNSFAGFPQGLSWPATDTILFANGDGVVSIPANGSRDPEVLVPRGPTERFFAPQLLPDVQGTAARYLATGHIVYAAGTELFAIPFDSKTRSTPGGRGVWLMDGLRRSQNYLSATANFAVSDTGTLVFLPGAGNLTRPYWVYRDGRDPEPLPVRRDDYTQLRLSPDSSKVAIVVGRFANTERPPAIWIYDFATQGFEEMTDEFFIHDSPVWSNDGSKLYFRSPQGATFGTTSILEFGLATRQSSRIVAGGDAVGGTAPGPWSVSPTGDKLAVNALVDGGSNLDFAIVSLPSGPIEPGLRGPGGQGQPVFAPRGSSLAYGLIDRGAGTNEIRLVPVPELTGQVPVGTGLDPVFKSSDGSELYYFNPDDGWIMAADIDYAPNARVIGTPRPLLDAKGFAPTIVGRVWDPDADGQRFLMLRDPGADAGRPRIEVVENWFQELEGRVSLE